MEHSTLSSVEIFNVDKQRLLVKLTKINASGREKKTSNLFSNFHYVKFSVKTMKKKKTLYSNLDLSQIAQRLCNLRSLNKTSELIAVAIW